MIKKIEIIKNIGVFSNFKSERNLEFKKLTFIYGENTYGKSTLCDIFQSLKSKDQNILENRETIPKGQNQEVVILDNNDKATVFRKGIWEGTTTNLEIFSNDFIEKNVFTNSSIAHGNKENFTKFILGGQGVRLIHEQRKKNERYRNLIPSKPDFVRNKSDEEVNKFIDLDLTNEKLEDIKQKSKDLISDAEEAKNNLQNANQIINMEECCKELKKTNIAINKNIDNINKKLQESIENIEKEAENNFFKHLNANVASDKENDATNWIKQGLEITKDFENGQCLFCGQPLKSVQELIRVYQKYFNQAYKEKEKNIKLVLNENLEQIKTFNLSTSAKDELSTLKNYQEYFDKNYKQKMTTFENLIKKFATRETQLNTEIERICKQLGKLINKKTANIQEKVENSNDYSCLQRNIITYQKLIDGINKKLKEFNCKIKDIKKPYRDNTAQQNIKRLGSEISELERKQKRIEQDTECEKYRKDLEDKKKLKDQLFNLKQKINEEQTEYLNKYFDKVNTLFQKFGSNDFTLERKESNQGLQKVFYFDIKYKGYDIASSNLSKVFSESDKRALALAIFFAKIEKVDQLKETTIILDDYVTSFDENRIKSTIMYTKEILKNSKQIIILTHYKKLILEFLEQCPAEKAIIKIDKNQITASLITPIEDEFSLESKMIKQAHKIYDFIDNKNDSFNIREVRIYLENFLKERFIAKTRELNIAKNEKLKRRINKLFANDPEIEQKLKDFVDNLNPEHHRESDNTVEDNRNLVRELMEFLDGLQAK